MRQPAHGREVAEGVSADCDEFTSLFNKIGKCPRPSLKFSPKTHSEEKRTFVPWITCFNEEWA
jgi:hypothetical protein